MENPFEHILIRLERIEKLLLHLGGHVDETGIVLNVNQASQYTNLSVARIYSLTSQKSIPHYKNGKKLYFKKSELSDWLTRTKIKTNEDIEKEALNYIIRNLRKF